MPSPTALATASLLAPSAWADDRLIAFHRDALAFGAVPGELFTMNVDGSGGRTGTVPSFRGFYGFPGRGQGRDAVS